MSLLYIEENLRKWKNTHFLHYISKELVTLVVSKIPKKTLGIKMYISKELGTSAFSEIFKKTLGTNFENLNVHISSVSINNYILK